MRELWAVETEIGGIKIIGSREEAEKFYEQEKKKARNWTGIQGMFRMERVRLLELSECVAKEWVQEVDDSGELTGNWEEIEY